MQHSENQKGFSRTVVERWRNDARWHQGISSLIELTDGGNRVRRNGRFLGWHQTKFVEQTKIAEDHQCPTKGHRDRLGRKSSKSEATIRGSNLEVNSDYMNPHT